MHSDALRRNQSQSDAIRRKSERHLVEQAEAESADGLLLFIGQRRREEHAAFMGHELEHPEGERDDDSVSAERATGGIESDAVVGIMHSLDHAFAPNVEPLSELREQSTVPAHETQSDAIRRNQTRSDAIRRNQTQSDTIRCTVPALRQDAVVTIELVRVVLVPVACRDRRERRGTGELQIGQVPMECTL